MSEQRQKVYGICPAWVVLLQIKSVCRSGFIARSDASILVQPELILECGCEIEEGWLPALSAAASKLLVAANAGGGAIDLWEGALLCAADVHRQARAERVAHLVPRHSDETAERE